MIAAIKNWLAGVRPETPLEKLQRLNDEKQAHIVSLHFKLAAANKRADEAVEDTCFWKGEWEDTALTLARMRNAKSAAVAKGNRTRKAKREAAARGEE